MGITVTNLNDLSQKSVDLFQAALDTQIQELQPLVDVEGGTFEDLLLHLKAVLDAATQENIDLVRQANSLQQVIANPQLADPTIVQLLLSNYNLRANLGTKASGPVTFVLSQLIGTVIPQGSLFVIQGMSFTSPVTYGVRTSPAAVLTPTDVLITQVGPGQYAFTVSLTAVNVGTTGNVLRGVTVLPQQPPAAFLRAYVQNDFTGGTNASTNQELLTQLAAGMAIGAWSNRVNIQSLITKQPAFANINPNNISIIGFGDPEMIRDQHAIWPGASGGRADVYVKSQPIYQNVAFTKTATLISKIGPLGTWQFGINRDDSPGFYRVLKILFVGEDPNDTGFPPTSDVRGIDLSGVDGPPDIINALEGTYGAFQTAVIQFVDNVTDATALVVGTATKNYQVVTQAMPLIGELQIFLLGRSVRPPMSDAEVKAPIPVFTTVACTVNYDMNTTPPDITTLNNAIAAAVNGLVYPGTLAASFIDQTIHNTYANVVSVTGFTITGTIRRTDGTTTFLTSALQITIPSVNNLMQSGRTAVFFLEPANISITLVAV